MKMPLEFKSISHGKIAFGFFNVETDMIPLNQTFLFAEDFVRHIAKATEKSNLIYETLWSVYLIEDQADMGNPMGAIYGIDLEGFIGEVYKLFPFPKHQEDFKQKPEGFKNWMLIEALIQHFAKKISIPFVINQEDDK